MRAADGPLQLIVPPEGTRSKTRYWKTGFYWIAREAERAHRHGLHGLPAQAQRPGADVRRPPATSRPTWREIKAFYAQFKGKNWQQFDHE